LTVFFRFDLKIGFYLLNASLAKTLSLKKNNLIRVVAENARGLVFLKNYLVALRENFKRVLFLDVKGRAKAHRQNYSAKLVNFAYYTG
jgi:hypothetical protein